MPARWLPPEPASKSSTYVPLLLLNLTRAGSAARYLGDHAGAAGYHEEALAIAERTHLPAFIELVTSELCADAAAAGDWRAAHTWALRAAEAGIPDVLYAGHNRQYEIEALVRGGYVRRAREETERFRERIGSNPRFRIPYLLSIAVLAEHEGEREGAVSLQEEAASLVRRLHLFAAGDQGGHPHTAV